jgi:hypothetical protein
MKVKAQIRSLVLGFATIVLLSGCQPVAAPVMGVILLDTQYGSMATDTPGATKEGKACAKSIMGLVATGDASIRAAKANGGITNVSHVDHSANSILGIIAEWCTIVRGE